MTARDTEEPEAAGGDTEPSNEKAVESRARSTSTSLVVPETLDHETLPGYPASTLAPLYVPSRAFSPFNHDFPISFQPQRWPNIYVTPASPQTPVNRSPIPSTSFLGSIYDAGDSAVLRLAKWVRPRRSHYELSQRRGSEDSEKGLDASEESSLASSEVRDSEDSIRRGGGKYWGLGGSGEASEDDAGYFSQSTTPSDEKSEGVPPDLAAAFRMGSPSLPTPALSAHPLSQRGSKGRSARDAEGEARDGWLRAVYSVWAGRGRGKTGQVLRELGWTVGSLAVLFVVTAAFALWLIQGMPITQLKHLPSSTTDLQLLSAEVRSYMASSDVSWWHTIGVMTFVGCWKHAWSFPGAVVLNILVGSVLEPMPALLLLTIITASGSLFSYLLSRPLAPLIAVLFPKPLAVVRAALAPDSPPSPTGVQLQGETVTAIHTSSDPSPPATGGPTAKSSVWRRLLIMRAMGFIPWSGMNVACGVVGLDWKTFWLTTAAGSASWSYVTASVGNILSRLALPTAALASSAIPDNSNGDSLTSLLRDPVLIFKLVFLSALTLLPVILKRRSPNPRSEPQLPGEKAQTPQLSQAATFAARLEAQSPAMSPLSQSLARFTPMPAAFDLLSFGRTAARQGGRVVLGGVKSAAGGAQRLASSLSRSSR